LSIAAISELIGTCSYDDDELTEMDDRGTSILDDTFLPTSDLPLIENEDDKDDLKNTTI